MGHFTLFNNFAPPSTEVMTMEEKTAVWQACRATFRLCKKDLLSDDVDPAEECHMELKPDDDKSRSLKQQKRSTEMKHHRRTGSNMTDITDATEEITDFAFLEELFDIPLTIAGGCASEDFDMQYVSY
ncbi:expressed unknown protein [Seminavis robusta]|uniref:Uncharacterized protein n=1 Tax=Seminavis robusta TaxID=568900 RepID=A0A9N8H3T5_9STRA|nr:expressed unknown protein [Seminavis robusta]|eukprot:Sro68_g038290.1 n/a (128) ;mRNA; f:112209-112592